MHGHLNVKFLCFSVGSSGASQPAYIWPSTAGFPPWSLEFDAGDGTQDSDSTPQQVSLWVSLFYAPSQHSAIDRHIITADPEVRSFISDFV